MFHEDLFTKLTAHFDLDLPLRNNTAAGNIHRLDNKYHQIFNSIPRVTAWAAPTKQNTMLSDVPHLSSDWYFPFRRQIDTENVSQITSKVSLGEDYLTAKTSESRVGFDYGDIFIFESMTIL